MAYASLVIGESGTGKSTALRNLNPEETFIINVIDKPLPFRGGGARYSVEKKNYMHSDNSDKIIAMMRAINQRALHIKTIVIDDFQYIMSNEFMKRAKDKGFDKFTEIAQNAFNIVNEIRSCREDLQVFVLTHSDIDDHGRVKCKTIGKLLDDKINVEGLFSMVFHTQVMNGEYKFLVQNDGTRMAKSPMGMFEERYVDNDLESIRNTIHAYFIAVEPCCLTITCAPENSLSMDNLGASIPYDNARAIEDNPQSAHYKGKLI